MTTTTLASLLPDVVALAVAAGAGIEAARHAPGGVQTKADGSPVSQPDRDAHALIVPALRALTPGVPIVSEEGDMPADADRTQWREFWLVDPLDGTREYLAGRPDYTVNIALVRDGRPVLGVVHAPGHDVTYWAVEGEGSWRRRGDGVAVRIVAQPPAPGAALRVAESRSHGSPVLDDVLGGYRVGERIAIGSSIKFCFVAEGTADCYVRLGPTMEWDVAAGDCVFRCATADGTSHPSPLTYNKPGLRNAGFVLGFLPPRPAVVWFTGLSGAGKSTIAAALLTRLHATGAAVELLDGDVLRAQFPGTGFSRTERDSHNRRVAFMASRLEAHGVTVLVSLVSPYRESRDAARALCRTFVEVHVATPLAVCEARDTKGLYAQARAGTLTNLSGVGDPYEAPERAELVIDANVEPAEAAAGRILAWLQRPRALAPDEGAHVVTHLDALEHRSVHVLREAYASFEHLCMLWSIGKDSTVMLWLARKAFFGHVPFPLVHIDTSYKIPEMIAYRDRLVAEWGLHLIYGQHEAALQAGTTFPRGAVDRLACCGLLKTQALKDTLSGEGRRYRFNHRAGNYELDPNTEAYTGVIVGARADEEGSRSKERYFSPRSRHNEWDVAEQPPEFWNQVQDRLRARHPRAHPPAARLDRAERVGVHRTRADSGRAALLRPRRRHALPVVGVRALHVADCLDGPHRGRDHRGAEDRHAQAHRRAVGPGAGRRRRRPRDPAPQRLHVAERATPA